MRKPALLAALVASGVGASVAYAQMPTPSPLTIIGSGAVSKGVGTKAKPVPISVKFSVVTGTKDGSRPQGWKSINVFIPKAQANGGLFPKCDINKFAAAQSPKACPTGSRIATGKLTARIGPDKDFSEPGAPCAKDITLFNAGAGKVIAYLSGTPSKCAGISYQPPFPGTLKNSSKGTTLNVPIPPDTITRPLPGVLGSSTSQTNTFARKTVSKGGKLRGFFESVGCKKGSTRTATVFVVGDPDSKKYTAKVKVGKC